MCYRLFSFLMLAVIALGISGCGGEGTSADPLGTDTLASFTSSAEKVDPNGTVELTATVTTASGLAVVGRKVYFAFVPVPNPSGAILSHLIAETNAAGKATVLYTAGETPGRDVVRASLSYTNVFMDKGITVGSGGGGGSQIAITGSPTSLAAGQNSILTATVTDSSGNPVSGQAVVFSFISNLSGAPALTVLNGGLTDASGRAVAVYTAGTGSPGSEVQDTVKAEIVGASSAALILTRTAATASTRTLALSAGTSSLAAGQSSILTATVADTTGKPLSGQVVTFQFLGGVAAPSGATLATLNGGTTDAGGQALAVYTAGSLNPTVGVQDVVEALITGASGVVIITRTASTFVPSRGYRMALTADVTSLAAGQSAVVTATVTDGSGNPASGQVVNFQFLGGVPAPSGATLTPLNGGLTDAAGIAVAVYTAGATSPTKTVQDIIQASITGSTATGAVIITRTTGTGTGTADYISSLNPSPSTVSGGQMSIIQATVRHVGVYGETSNQTITFTIPVNISGASFIDSSGAPVSTITIPLQLDWNTFTDISVTYKAGMDVPGTEVEDMVRAVLGNGSTKSIIITRAGSTIGYTISLTASPSTLATRTGTSAITATVKDSSGNNAGGMSVHFDNPYPGTLDTNDRTTDTGGLATVTFTSTATYARAISISACVDLNQSGYCYNEPNAAVVVTIP